MGNGKRRPRCFQGYLWRYPASPEYGQFLLSNGNGIAVIRQIQLLGLRNAGQAGAQRREQQAQPNQTFPGA